MEVNSSEMIEEVCVFKRGKYALSNHSAFTLQKKKAVVAFKAPPLIQEDGLFIFIIQHIGYAQGTANNASSKFKSSPLWVFLGLCIVLGFLTLWLLPTAFGLLATFGLLTHGHILFIMMTMLLLMWIIPAIWVLWHFSQALCNLIVAPQEDQSLQARLTAYQHGAFSLKIIAKYAMMAGMMGLCVLIMVKISLIFGIIALLALLVVYALYFGKIGIPFIGQSQLVQSMIKNVKNFFSPSQTTLSRDDMLGSYGAPSTWLNEEDKRRQSIFILKLTGGLAFLIAFFTIINVLAVAHTVSPFLGGVGTPIVFGICSLLSAITVMIVIIALAYNASHDTKKYSALKDYINQQDNVSSLS
jgi:hypothetical protein